MVIAAAQRRRPKSHAAATGDNRPARRRRRWSKGITPLPKRIASARMSTPHCVKSNVNCKLQSPTRPYKTCEFLCEELEWVNMLRCHHHRRQQFVQWNIMTSVINLWHAFTLI